MTKVVCPVPLGQDNEEFIRIAIMITDNNKWVDNGGYRNNGVWCRERPTQPELLNKILLYFVPLHRFDRRSNSRKWWLRTRSIVSWKINVSQYQRRKMLVFPATTYLLSVVYIPPVVPAAAFITRACLVYEFCISTRCGVFQFGESLKGDW